ncbi:MAG: rhomboid family intramembrane serine protease [Cytophagales bacterium]|nr:rhomboid family intramembrane serine protease [Cytophaga sp.]
MNYGITPNVQRLLLINIGVFVLMYLLNISPDVYRIFSLNSIYSGNFIPTQFVTYMFLHDRTSIMHLLGNMFGLYMFGSMLEHFLGSKKFLILYMVCGIGSGFLYWGLNAYQVHKLGQETVAYMNGPNPDQFANFVKSNDPRGYQNYINLIDAYGEKPDDAGIIYQTKQEVAYIYDQHTHFGLVGASGAVFGILMAFALLFPNTEMMLLFFPFPIKAKYLVGAYGLYELYQQFQNRPDDNIAHFAHLAGMLFAFILIRYWKTDRNSFY